MKNELIGFDTGCALMNSEIKDRFLKTMSNIYGNSELKYNNNVEFKVWCTDKQIWLDKEKIAITCDGSVLVATEYGYSYLNNTSVKISRFIGLFYKNGEPIYEGDIILCQQYGEKVKGIIYYNNQTCSYRIYWLTETQLNDLVAVRTDCIEKISDIYVDN